MSKFKRKYKKPFKRRLLAWLGISNTSKKYYLIYFIAIIALVILFPLIIKILTSFKENYGKGYGYAPKDIERIEKFTRDGKSLPLQSKETWRYSKENEE